MIRTLGWILLLGTLILGCGEKLDYIDYLESNRRLIEAGGTLTDAMVHDIFSPPVASRIYAYPSIAAYEIGVLADPSTYRSLMGQLNDFEPKSFQVTENVSLPLAALIAYYDVASRLVFSEHLISSKKEQLLEKVKNLGASQAILQESKTLGESMANHVLDYASKDNYHQSRSFEKYTSRDEDYSWKPTPPAYIEGIEPNWNKIRPFVLDSADQFIPRPATEFGNVPDSQFYIEAKEVMDAGNSLTPEQREIAYFWDCNPYKMNVKGHVMYAEKKITPGGHWIGIAGIASKNAELGWIGTAEALAVTAIYVFDGFISCWDEKYRSVLIRPETYINRYMDEDWVPLLQTPPFPEYTSGHSVISTAASRALTGLLGEPFRFVDTTEVNYGLGTREFQSFNQAAEEAAISRFYGGIHYIPAIEEGVKQGEMVAVYIAQKVSTRLTKNIGLTD
ncbi:MAG: vanadium-dependent haloperoxidase [Lunatimonas sp.]|uniref:vanadium-dependent haloperoxidase n=1 Tax=Lunatimonas sp. TaxID=2060141 RepID=UPI00263A53F9|nr:vanadium-dependent haloperoxidase [Lunatimonas sp.]MCC5939744.1 vanadium-dependent haloperoxidase [Lunatimonas sp.]